MNFTLMPSLKHRALVKIAIALCSQSDVKDLLMLSESYTNPDVHYTNIKNPKEWQVIDEKVKENIPELPLPELLKKEVLDLTQPIGLEMKNFMDTEIFRLIYLLRRDLLDELCWTPQGTIDEKKTAEVLIKDESLDIVNRYRLACFYCLEDNVKELWNSMPYVCKEDDIYSNDFQNSNYLSQLVVHWTHDVEGDLTCFSDTTGREISPYLKQFELSAMHGNKAATEYFWQKLTPEERNDSLVKWVEDIAKTHLPIRFNRFEFFRVIHFRNYFSASRSSVLCFLLSLMNKEQEVKVFMNCSPGILWCLLVWPWQSFFIETANRLWKFLSEFDYELLLRAIVYKRMDGFMDYSYRIVFEEFWQQSPNTHKKFVIGRLTNGSLLSGLFHIEDRETIRLILKSATIEEREEMIFSSGGKNICRGLISRNKWDLLAFFIQECISSKNIMIKFKTHMISIILKSEKDKFFSILDKLTYKDNEKRGMEEATSSSSKKTKI